MTDAYRDLIAAFCLLVGLGTFLTAVCLWVGAKRERVYTFVLIMLVLTFALHAL